MTKTRIDKKLHCNKCGKKRNLSLTFPFPNEDEPGKFKLVQVNMHNLLNFMKAGILPNSKGFDFKQAALIGICPVCTGMTNFEIRNNKLHALDAE